MVTEKPKNSKEEKNERCSFCEKDMGFPFNSSIYNYERYGKNGCYIRDVGQCCASCLRKIDKTKKMKKTKNNMTIETTP